jgi:LAO/AO transport system kinase
MIDALDAAGFGLILLETVGTGQSEVDVAEIADVVLVVSAPGLGDGIQAMKAGLLEIAHILVVNKADREGAERTADELAAALALRAASGDVPVLRTSALTGTGVPELWRAVAERGARQRAEPLALRRRRRARYLIARAAADLIAARIRRGGASTDVLADSVLAGSIQPLDAAARLLAGRDDDVLS